MVRRHPNAAPREHLLGGGGQAAFALVPRRTRVRHKEADPCEGAEVPAQGAQRSLELVSTGELPCTPSQKEGTAQGSAMRRHRLPEPMFEVELPLASLPPNTGGRSSEV